MAKDLLKNNKGFILLYMEVLYNIGVMKIINGIQFSFSNLPLMGEIAEFC
jgi:hypothetical protein